MNRVLTILLVVLVSTSAYLLWWVHSRIPPEDSQLASDLAYFKDRRHDATRASIVDAIDAQTEAMLLQKRAAILRFVDLKFTVNGELIAPASPSELEVIESDLLETTRALREAREESTNFTGGVILTFITMRIAIEEATLAALRQKKLMRKYGLALPAGAVPQPHEPDVDQLASLAREIAEKQRAITAAEEEAARYSGGLLQVTALLRAATERATLAMLEQQRVALKFGITYPQGARKPESREPGRVVTDKEALQ